jgi:hypothetical protein
MHLGGMNYFSSVLDVVKTVHEEEVNTLNREIERLRQQLGESSGVGDDLGVPSERLGLDLMLENEDLRLESTSQQDQQCPDLKKHVASRRSLERSQSVSSRSSDVPSSALSLRIAADLRNVLDVDDDTKRQKLRFDWQSHAILYLETLLDYHQDDFRITFMRSLGLSRDYMDPPNTIFARVVTHKAFQALTVSMVILNVLWIAFETQTRLTNLLQDVNYTDPYWYAYVSNTFAFIFFLELVVRMSALRWSFLFASDWRWNLFDILMVLSTGFDLVSGVDMRFTRVIRVARMTRVLRIVRVLRFFHDLKAIAVAMFCSGGTLFSAIVMILLILLLFAMLFMQAASSHISDYQYIPNGLDDRFGSIDDSMVSLFYAISGGADWGDITIPINEIGWVYRLIFILYVTSMIFGVTNILIGIFCNVALAGTGLDRDLAVQDQQSQMTSFLVTCKEIYEEMEPSPGAGVSWEDFQRAMSDEQMKTFLMSRGLNVLDVRELFELIDELDENPNEMIDCQTFMLGMMKLTGPAKCTDLYLLLHEHRKLFAMVSDFIRLAHPELRSKIESKELTKDGVDGL